MTDSRMFDGSNVFLGLNGSHVTFCILLLDYSDLVDLAIFRSPPKACNRVVSIGLFITQCIETSKQANQSILPAHDKARWKENWSYT